jgi:hypothetical protein
MSELIKQLEQLRCGLVEGYTYHMVSVLFNAAIAEAAKVEEANKELREALEKAHCWVLWVQKRNKCTCEPNCRCVKCVATEDLKAVEQALKGSK